MAYLLKDHLKLLIKCDILIALEEIKKEDVFLKRGIDFSDTQTHFNPKQSPKSKLNTDLINRTGDRLVTFSEIMIWTTKNNVTKCLPILQFIYEELPIMDNKGRKSLEQYVSKITTQLVNCYDDYRREIQEAYLIRILLKNSLNLIQLGEHSDKVLTQRITEREGKKMRYKLVISNCKVIQVNSPHHNEDREDTKAYFLDIYLENKNILTGDYSAPDHKTGDIPFDTMFEIRTSLVSGYIEFKVLSTWCHDIKQRDFLSKKNVEELLQFSDTESNDHMIERNSNQNQLNMLFHHKQEEVNKQYKISDHVSNPFEQYTGKGKMNENSHSLRKADHNQSYETNEKSSIDQEPPLKNKLNRQMPKGHGVSHDDIKISIEEEKHAPSVSLTSKSLTKLSLSDPVVRQNSLLSLVKSPIKEAVEEDEASRIETPSQVTNPLQLMKTEKISSSNASKIINKAEGSGHQEDSDASPIHEGGEETKNIEKDPENIPCKYDDTDPQNIKEEEKSSPNLRNSNIVRNLNSEEPLTPMIQLHKRRTSEETDDHGFSHLMDDKAAKNIKRNQDEDIQETVSNLAMAGQLNPHFFGTCKMDIFSEVYSKVLEKHRNQQDSLIDQKSDSSSSINKFVFKVCEKLSLLQDDCQELEKPPEDQYEFEVTMEYELIEPFKTEEGKIITDPEVPVIKRCSIFEKNLDKLTENIEKHEYYMEALYEPFPMIEYDVNNFNINYTKIGKEEQEFDCDIGCISQIFRAPSNVGRGMRSSQEDVNASSSSSDKSRRCKCNIL
ncbi:unnamed protein product [Moneuplotes crassus]|uniref:Uncharacterized protein n=1 Tax=Euplotes crassus TaxID=5936 RepID=A0AAD1Y5H2_EUPCR|nr:unnamed protein product [Moneuplotes crassus]